MAEGGIAQGGTSSFTGSSSPVPSPILRNSAKHDFHREFMLRSGCATKDDRPPSGSSSGSAGGSGSSCISNTNGATSSASAGTGSLGSGGTINRKRVQIVTDSPCDELPPYKIDRNSRCKVSFPSRTWDIMMQGFRIALETDNVFVCDHFLGRDAAEVALTELRMLKETGQFERHMRRAAGEPSLKYACLYLMDQEEGHRQLDALVLMVYKLAHYYTSPWNKVSLELSYFPEGHRDHVSPRNADINRRLLKCIYFPNNDWNLSPPDPEIDYLPGMLTVKNGRRPPNRIEPVFDRLVAFWGDALDHTISECPDERFGVTVWLRR